MSKGAKFVPGEREGIAIRRVKEISRALSTHAISTMDLMREMVELLCDIRCTDNNPEIQKLINRLDDLRCLENQQELQSWQITVDHVMAEAWRQLP